MCGAQAGALLGVSALPEQMNSLACPSSVPTSKPGSEEASVGVDGGWVVVVEVVGSSVSQICTPGP